MGRPSGRKSSSRLELEAHAGKALVELLHRHGAGSTGGAVQQSLPPMEAAQNHEVVEVPVEDAGELPVGLQVLGLKAVALGGEPVVPGGPEEVPGVGPVPGHAAVPPDLLQGNPFSIVSQNHGQAGRAALQGLQLHHHRHLGAAPGHGALDVLSHDSASVDDKRHGGHALQRKDPLIHAVRQVQTPGPAERT